MEKNMQKLEGRDTYAPTDAPQVRSNRDSVLNREETLSVLNLKTPSNNSEVDYSQHRGSSDSRVQNIVYVLNMRGYPLMPTTQQKANKILKTGKAKVVKRTPFTIQLKYPTGEAKQPIILGVDAGYNTIGFSAVSEKKELISGEIKLRSDISKKLTERRMYRRTRRSRLWYREPRFNNREKEDDWLAPSIQHKLNTHIRLIEKIKKMLPIIKTIIEVSSFDTQKMQNPEISGVEYQQGELQGYEVREYLLEKWGRKCAYCNKTDTPLEVEHIVPKSRGGSDRVSNLTISCHKCNQKKGNMTAEEFGHPGIQKQANETLKATTFMSIVRKRLAQEINATETYGYVTKHNRIKQELEKSHTNDAFVIANGTNQTRATSFIVRQVRRNNRCLQKNRNGFKPSIRRRRYERQPNDLVTYDGQVYRVKGVYSCGRQVKLVDEAGNIINTNPNNIKLIQYGKGMTFGGECIGSLSSHA